MGDGHGPDAHPLCRNWAGPFAIQLSSNSMTSIRIRGGFIPVARSSSSTIFLELSNSRVCSFSSCVRSKAQKRRNAALTILPDSFGDF